MTTLLEFKKSNIRKEAFKQGWRATYYKPEKEILGFYKDNCHLEVHARTMEVVTVLKHPRGFRTLYRKNMGLLDLQSVLTNPRHHSDKGYYKHRVYTSNGGHYNYK